MRQPDTDFDRWSAGLIEPTALSLRHGVVFNLRYRKDLQVKQPPGFANRPTAAGILAAQEGTFESGTNPLELVGLV